MFELTSYFGECLLELLLAELFEYEPLTNKPLSSSLSNSTSDVGESIPYSNLTANRSCNQQPRKMHDLIVYLI